MTTKKHDAAQEANVVEDEMFEDDFEDFDDYSLEEEKTENLEENQSQKYSPEQEAELKIFAQDFFDDVKALAKQYMEHFFQDKMLYCGGKIPKSFLFAERCIGMVMNYDIIRGVEHAYSALEKNLTKKEIDLAKSTGETTSDIKLVNETLNLLARSGIPQQFAGGMMCLYLEFVEGVDGM